MPVTTGGVEAAKGKWRIWWWMSVVVALAGLTSALISGRGVLALGIGALIYPLQRLFWNSPGTDPSKSGWQRARERRSAGSGGSIE